MRRNVNAMRGKRKDKILMPMEEKKTDAKRKTTLMSRHGGANRILS